MKKSVLTIIAIHFSFLSLFAQYVRSDNQAMGQPATVQQPYNIWDHTSIGGNLSLQFGSVTYIVLAPLLNFHLNKNIVIGAGPYYQYFNEQEPYGNFSSSIYGGRAVGMLFLPAPLSRIFLQGEYDVLNVPDVYSNSTDARASVGIPLVGAGFRQPAGNRCYFTIAVLFDLSNSPLSPYYVAPDTYAPVFFAGIDIGL